MLVEAKLGFRYPSPNNAEMFPYEPKNVMILMANFCIIN